MTQEEFKEITDTATDNTLFCNKRGSGVLRTMKKEQRLKVYQKYGGHCAYCGKAIEYKDMQVDHISSRYRHRMRLDGKSEDELDSLENLNPSCRMCNFRKGALTIEQFREEVARQAATEMKRFQARMSEAYGLIVYYPNHDVKFYFEKQ